MLTSEQEHWLSHLSDTNSTVIHPADPNIKEKFERMKKLIQSLFGTSVQVLHKGATSLGISGQGEINLYIPVLPEKFDLTVTAVTTLFGYPGSLYPLERARFVATVDDTKIEIFVINEHTKGWTDSCIFEEHLRNHPDDLRVYEKLKQDGHGLSTQKYYRRKLEFINKILNKIAL